MSDLVMKIIHFYNKIDLTSFKKYFQELRYSMVENILVGIGIKFCGYVKESVKKQITNLHHVCNKILEFPVGYPYALYLIQCETYNKYMLAVSQDSAAMKLNIKKSDVIPVTMKELLDQKGHVEARKLLTHFNDEWLTKNGNIFYKEANQNKGLYIETRSLD